MKDSTMILVIAAIIAAAALPGLATSYLRVESATQAIEHVRVASPGLTTFRMHTAHRAPKGWMSL
jgi:type II secretory pathway pseudopilin PulG